MALEHGAERRERREISSDGGGACNLVEAEGRGQDGLPHDMAPAYGAQAALLVRCSDHTAVQRRRDRLMLAGQVAEGIVKGDLHETYEAIAKSCIEIAQASLTIADAILDRADERRD